MLGFFSFFRFSGDTENEHSSDDGDGGGDIEGGLAYEENGSEPSFDGFEPDADSSADDGLLFDEESENFEYRLISDGLYWIRNIDSDRQWILAHETHPVLKFCRHLKQRTDNAVKRFDTSVKFHDGKIPGIVGFFTEHVARITGAQARIGRSGPEGDVFVEPEPYCIVTSEAETDNRRPKRADGMLAKDGMTTIQLEKSDVENTIPFDLECFEAIDLESVYTADELCVRGHMKRFECIGVPPGSSPGGSREMSPVSLRDFNWYTITISHYALFMAYCETLQSSPFCLARLAEMRDSPISDAVREIINRLLDNKHELDRVNRMAREHAAMESNVRQLLRLLERHKLDNDPLVVRLNANSARLDALHKAAIN